MTVMRFNDALRHAALATQDKSLPSEWAIQLVRDVYGRLRFAVNCEQEQFPAKARTILEAAQAALGAYATAGQMLFRDNFSNPDSVFSGPDWHRTLVAVGCDEDGEPLLKTAEGRPIEEIEVMLLDRQITGQDWLRPQEVGGRHPHRFVFFGLKGGVGRSTALTMVAWGLAKQGKRVLLLDFDLESPGLSGLVLPLERVADYGLVDWLVEDAVGQGEGVLNHMVAASPLAETTTGAIRVAGAMGNAEDSYLSKLSRAYADVPGSGGPQHMGMRMRKVLELLEAQEEPDVVLIDSRAGLHDLAAVSITSLADTALLFATDSAQTWMGYRQLFNHWQRSPDVATRVRERLAVVRALTPTSERENGVKRFQQEAYELFAETLYDAIPSDAEAGELSGPVEQDYFHPSESDEAAPHFPILIDWDERFQEFDPRLRPEQGGVTASQLEATFGTLISWVNERVSENTK